MCVCTHVFVPLLQTYSNIPCFCCLKAHLHVSPNTLSSEHCQTGVVQSKREHHTTGVNTLVLGHRFEITLNTNQVKLRLNKKNSKLDNKMSNVCKDKKERGYFIWLLQVKKTTRNFLHCYESTVWRHLTHGGLALRMLFLHSQFAFTGKKKK